jgi:hypothetical protein
MKSLTHFDQQRVIDFPHDIVEAIVQTSLKVIKVQIRPDLLDPVHVVTFVEERLMNPHV